MAHVWVLNIVVRGDADQPTEPPVEPLWAAIKAIERLNKGSIHRAWIEKATSLQDVVPAVGEVDITDRSVLDPDQTQNGDS